MTSIIHAADEFTYYSPLTYFAVLGLLGFSPSFPLVISFLKYVPALLSHRQCDQIKPHGVE